MPKSLLEAAASGCAVVATDVVGCRHPVRDGIIGDLVPAASVLALADTLGKLIADPERQQSYGKAGLQLAEERLGIDVVVSATVGVYGALWLSESKKANV